MNNGKSNWLVPSSPYLKYNSLFFSSDKSSSPIYVMNFTSAHGFDSIAIYRESSE